MTHWRKRDYKQAPSLGRPEMLAHAGSMKAGREIGGGSSPSWLRIAIGCACWIIVIGVLWLAHRMY